MRIAKEHFPEATAHVDRLPSSVTAAATSTTAWLVLALGGVAVAVSDLGPATTIVGVIVAVAGAHTLGVRDGRRDRSPDPRTAALSAQNERLRTENAALLLELLEAERGDGPARGAEPAPAEREPRPSAGVRGGGRPGMVAPLAAVPGLDAPLAGENAGATA